MPQIFMCRFLMKVVITIMFATTYLLTSASAAKNLKALPPGAQPGSELLASRKQTGKGSSKAEAYADAMSKMPLGAVIAREIRTGANHKRLCHVYY